MLNTLTRRCFEENEAQQKSGVQVLKNNYDKNKAK